jgi:tetratricopeptide (TPR) repeat protein
MHFRPLRWFVSVLPFLAGVVTPLLLVAAAGGAEGWLGPNAVSPQESPVAGSLSTSTRYASTPGARAAIAALELSAADGDQPVARTEETNRPKQANDNDAEGKGASEPTPAMEDAADEDTANNDENGKRPPESTAGDAGPKTPAPATADKTAADKAAADKAAADKTGADKAGAKKSDDPSLPNLRLVPDVTDAAEDDSPAVAAPAPADAGKLKPDAEKIKLDAAEFNGVQPGRSTTDDVIAAWGQPAEVTTQHNVVRHKYIMEPFKQILVTYYKGKVQSLVVQLQHHFPPADVAKQLQLDIAQSATINDDSGEPIGLVFPERGVVFAYIPGMKTPTIAQVILEGIDAQSFVLRAESRLAGDYTHCQQDIDMALELDHEYGRAYWLRSVLLSRLGNQTDALRAADEATRLDPKNPEFRLTRAKILAAGGQFPQAINETKEALALSVKRPEMQARAMQQLGDQLATGPSRDHKRSLELQMQAIRVAEPLLTAHHAAVRRMAQETLLDAHLSAARNIAWGNWKMKTKVVPKWLARAEALARDAQSSSPQAAGPPSEGAPSAGAPPGGAVNADFDLRVCQAALAVCVGMEGEMDPTPWAKKTLSAARAMIETTEDPLRKRQLQWELGAALYDALQVYHVLAKSELALEYGNLAVENLEAGSQDRQLEPAEAYLLGRLYFRMGSVHAAGEKDHQQAVVWFEKAVPLLERPVPPSAYADVGRQGETFVSMAVSYWAAGSHDEAMRLTRRGVKYIEEAIKDGILGEDSLVIPYSNLATMHRYLGDADLADSFTEMAAKAQGTRTE